MKRWRRFRYTPCLPLGDDGRRVTGCKEHIELSRNIATQGMVLLKNDSNILPLKKGTKVALFGKASVDYVKGGGGSGDVTVAYVHNLCDGMELKQSEGKVEVFSPLNDFYRENVKKQYENGVLPGQTNEPELPEQLIEDARRFADIAIISICRYSSENFDRFENDDYFLSESESKMIKTVTDYFNTSILVLNVGGIVDTSYFKSNDKISSVLLGWQAGMEGGYAEADILCGDVCPSGKLTDTFAARISDYPSYKSFNESLDYVYYTDDIYVGYRYFETIPNAKKLVNYPFGFGLSYTKFNVEYFVEKDDENIYVTAKVKNVGTYAGKEVIQVYSASPLGKLDKPAKELRAFLKTELLLPNSEQTLKLSYKIKDMASYDEKRACYVLEKGVYKVFAGTDVQSATCYFEFTLKDDVVTEQLSNLCVAKQLPYRLKADGTYEQLSTEKYEELLDTSDWPNKPQYTFEHILPDRRDCDRNADNLLFEDVVDDDEMLDKMISQMSNDELIEIVGGKPNTGVANVWGLGDMPEFDIPALMTADGPAGLRIKPDVGINTTAWPCATLLACCFEPELLYNIGKFAAKEVKENNFGVWLTPALNIHRNPLCGRNFEYYSEDPLVSGRNAAAMVNGIQSEGISACVKHFACNNKEINRTECDSVVSERALREIYLKGFEITVKESSPWAIMTAYNIINGRHCSENSELLKGILRGEWGFDGMINTDWGNHAEHYRELLAGNNLRMPTGSGRRLQKALELGLIKRDDLIYNVRYVLKFFRHFN